MAYLSPHQPAYPRLGRERPVAAEYLRGGGAMQGDSESLEQHFEKKLRLPPGSRAFVERQRRARKMAYETALRDGSGHDRADRAYRNSAAVGRAAERKMVAGAMRYDQAPGREGAMNHRVIRNQV